VRQWITPRWFSLPRLLSTCLQAPNRAIVCSIVVSSMMLLSRSYLRSKRWQRLGMPRIARVAIPVAIMMR
jgi:hypothetical protein